MTLKEYLESSEYPFQPKAFDKYHGFEDPILTLAVAPHVRGLPLLDDYAVSSIAGGSYWLMPRTKVYRYDWLKEFFTDRDDVFWNINAGHFILSDYSACVCTGYTLEVERHLIEFSVERMGFFCSDNPAASRLSEYTDGHDFALVQNRYIVDPWVSEVELISDRVVFDREDPAQAEEILALYGDPDKWMRTP